MQGRPFLRLHKMAACCAGTAQVDGRRAGLDNAIMANTYRACYGYADHAMLYGSAKSLHCAHKLSCCLASLGECVTHRAPVSRVVTFSCCRLSVITMKLRTTAETLPCWNLSALLLQVDGRDGNRVAC